MMAMAIKPPQAPLRPGPLIENAHALHVGGLELVRVLLALLGTPLDKAVYFGLGRRRAPGR
jgi:hypothetical protein